MFYHARLKTAPESEVYLRVELDDSNIIHVLKKNNWKNVLIEDGHGLKGGYTKGLLNFNEKDPEVYYLKKKVNGKERIERFHVHDLLGLMVQIP